MAKNFIRAGVVTTALVAIAACAPSGKGSHVLPQARTANLDVMYPVRFEKYSVPLTIKAGKQYLSGQDRTALMRFAHLYQQKGEGTITVAMPEKAAPTVKDGIYRILSKNGLAGAAVLAESETGNYELSFHSVHASTGPCLPEAETAANFPFQAGMVPFGCAHRKNLVAQVADPRDLRGEAGTRGAADAETTRRVVRAFRDGEETQSAISERTREGESLSQQADDVGGGSGG